MGTTKFEIYIIAVQLVQFLLLIYCAFISMTLLNYFGSSEYIGPVSGVQVSFYAMV